MAILKKSISVLATAALAAFLFTATTGCDDDPVVTTIVDDTSGNNTDNEASVALDDFTIHPNDTDFTIQTSLGSALGSKLDTMAWGGGQWYAYASGTADGDSACVYSFNEAGDPDTIVTLAAMEPADTEKDPLKMFGDSTLTVALDAIDAAADKEASSYYYAAIGCALVGDVQHLEGVTGYDSITAKDVGANSNVKTITWNLSNLQSITIKGKVTGAFTFNFNGVTSDGNVGVALAKVSSPDPANETELVDLDTTISMASFEKAGWNGATWDEIKAKVYEVAIELNTDATAGGDFVSLKLEKIMLNFDTKANKEAAFPFLAK